MGAVTGNLDVYLEGLRTTLALVFLSYAAALALGTLVAAARVSPVPPLRLGGGLYVELVRNTPLVVLMFLFLFGLPKLGLVFSPFRCAVLALSLYTGAFVAETVRSGVNAVPSGQAEAARALGLTFPQTLGTVVLPQALRTVVAPLGSLFIALIKNSAVAFTISVPELARRVDQLNTETAQTIPLLIGAAIAYLALTVPSGLAFGVLERRLAVRR
jgi:glutamate transport system permease protein